MSDIPPITNDPGTVALMHEHARRRRDGAAEPRDDDRFTRPQYAGMALAIFSAVGPGALSMSALTAGSRGAAAAFGGAALLGIAGGIAIMSVFD